MKCKMSECERQHYARSFCRYHYRKMRAYDGSPFTSRLHNIWASMIQRCHNSRAWNYSRYGAKGIAVCGEWRQDFLTFYSWALDNGYTDELTIDRINNAGNYSPSNCRWLSIAAQQNNRDSNVQVNFAGQKLNLTQWARRLGWSPSTLITRHSRGWSIERMLTTAPRQRAR